MCRKIENAGISHVTLGPQANWTEFFFELLHIATHSVASKIPTTCAHLLVPLVLFGV